MKNQQKGSATVIVLVFTVIVLLVMGGYFYFHFQSTQPVQDNSVEQIVTSASPPVTSQNIPENTSQSTNSPEHVATQAVPDTTMATPTTSGGEVDCGSQTYTSITTEGQGIATSACFNQQFSECKSAKISGTVTAYNATTKFEIVGKSSGMCKVVETVTAPTLPQPTILSCLFNNTETFATASLDTSKCTSDTP